MGESSGQLQPVNIRSVSRILYIFQFGPLQAKTRKMPNFSLFPHGKWVKVAHLQSDFLHEIIFLSYEFSHEKCSDICPEMFEPLFCVGLEKSRKIIPAKFPCPKSKNHARASAGAQGEIGI